MAFSAVVVLICGLLWAKSCKPVEYEFKQFGVTYHGYGAKKGCFTPQVEYKDTKKGEELEAEDCAVIKKDGKTDKWGGVDLTGSDDEDLERTCNQFATCVWKGGKCKAASCPDIKSRSRCYNGKFKNGKCEKLTGDDCVSNSGNSYYLPTPNNDSCQGMTPAYTCPPSDYGSGYCDPRTDSSGTTTNYCRVYGPKCSDLTKYYLSQDGDLVKESADEQKVCQYQCDHPPYEVGTEGPYEYTVDTRKYYHNQLGCLYAVGGGVSAWSIWAFVLALVLSIVVVVGAVVFVIVAHFVLKLF